ncbi:MAG: hypothetical protein ACJ8AT_08495 [Hyalangium sp.]|uniref:hypothetical protein n=1 Tax=Hyalangium sp. TaxID=2028555 RepID=UPI00389A5221
MSLSRLVLCLTLLGSSLGFAQTPEEWTPYAPPANEGTTPPPLVPANPPSEPPPPSEAPPPSTPPAPPPPRGESIRHPVSGTTEAGQTALRLVVDPWAGSITGMMGLVIGVVPSAIIGLPFCLGTQGTERPACAIAVSTGLGLSYTAGVALGIYFVGGVMDGRGEGLPTFLGALAGATVGAGIGVSTQDTPALFLGLAVGPLLGAVLGYEFSHANAAPPDKPALQSRSGFRVMPMASATPRGGFLGGLCGQF